ncbi:MAG: hypothetical protein WBP34_06095 [Thermoanaerobaculia bacterium]
MAKSRLRAPLFLVAALMAQSSLNAQESAPEHYSLSGRDAPTFMVMENFMALATAAYLADDPEHYSGFCAEFGIKSEWPSARSLGTAYLAIDEEYRVRVAQANQTSTFTDFEGRDPNEWKNEALGQAFGEVFEELRRDGLRRGLKGFIILLEGKLRDGFTSHSTNPFTEEDLSEKADRFWTAMEEVSEQAREYRLEGGEQ